MMTNPTFINTTGLDYAELNPEIIVRVGTADKEQYEDIKRLWVFLKTEEKHGQKYSSNVSYTFPANNPDDIVQGGVVAVAADGSTFVWSPDTSQGLYAI